jgi:two-component system NtrC family sensor kinase
LILGIAGLWNLHLQRRHLMRLVTRTANGVVDTIRGSTRDAMLRDNPEEVERIIQSVATQEGIVRIRVFNKEGRIRISSQRDEEETFVDKDAEQCFACHQQDRPLESLDREDRTRIFRGADGNRILGIILPIHNEPACSTGDCHVHDPSTNVLGVLDVQLSLAEVDKDLRASQTQMIIALTDVVIALLVLAIALVWRMVLVPVSRLTAATRQVANGDYDAVVPVRSNDELAELSRSWNQMIVALRSAREELNCWSRTLEERVAEKTRELKTAHERMLMVERMASLGKLAAVVAHEINNPLSGIRTYARLLRRRFALAQKQLPPDLPPLPCCDEETQRVLQVVEEEAARCGEIVRNLLLFSRTPGARFTRQSMADLISRCVLLVRHRAELADVSLAASISEGIPEIVCDPSQIQQVILALVVNAIEATPSGGSVEVALAHHPERGEIEIRVTDTGAGIPEEHRSRIFEPFFSTKHESSGVGLGLAVVYGIVNRHHGTIELESEVGKGTTFRVFLPVEQPEEAAGPRQPGAERS